MVIRTLNSDDVSGLTAYLRRHYETSMFMLSNVQSSGLTYSDAAFHGTYMAAFNDRNNIAGVLVHYWNGNVMMQSPDMQILRGLLTFYKGLIKRPVTGVMGENTQAVYTIAQLDLSKASFTTNRSECLYSLDLTSLVTPELDHRLDERVLDVNEISASLLLGWIKAYNREALGYMEGERIDARSLEQVARLKESSNCWALLHEGQPVSLSAFNARIEDMVQIGPVWTPPEFRNNGFARYLLAATLNNAFAKGVNKAILFTNEPSAERAYKAIGFKPIGHYRLAILKQPVTIE